MDELIAFIRAQLDRQEDGIRQALRTEDEWVSESDLVDVQAKRRIVDLHSGEHDCRTWVTGVYPADWPQGAVYGAAGQPWAHAMAEHFTDQPCDTLRLLASVYRDHPDYETRWGATDSAQ